MAECRSSDRRCPVREGSTAKRVAIGFGAGASELGVAVEGYQMTAQELRRLGWGDEPLRSHPISLVSSFEKNACVRSISFANVLAVGVERDGTALDYFYDHSFL